MLQNGLNVTLITLRCQNDEKDVKNKRALLNLGHTYAHALEKCCKYLEIDTKLICSSTLNVSGKRTEKLVNICKIFSADSYLSTIGTKENYLEENKEE